MTSPAVEARPQDATPAPNTNGLTAPTPKTAAEAAARSYAGETPEQTIAGLREALARANEEAKQSRLQAKEVTDFRDALKQVFGGAVEGEKPEDVVKNLQAQMAQMQHDLRFNEVARTFGITDEKDLALLRQAPTPDLMTAWGERLKPTATTSTQNPAADPGQGARPGTEASDDAAYKQFFPDSK